MYSEAEFRVAVAPARVNIDAGFPADWTSACCDRSPPLGAVTIGLVLEPTTTAVASESRLMRVPETVIAGPPGLIVWSPKTYSKAEPELAVNVRAGTRLTACT
jgi:hypothetical protein